MCRSHAQAMENCNHTFHVTRTFIPVTTNDRHPFYPNCISPSNRRRDRMTSTRQVPSSNFGPQNKCAPSGSTAIRPRLHHPVPPPSDQACTVWFHRPQTTLAPSGATALRPRLHLLILPPLDHDCTAWFYRPQTTLVTSGLMAQKPLERLPQLTPNVNRTPLQLTGWYLTVPPLYTKQQ